MANGAVARLPFDPPSTGTKPAAPPVAIQVGIAVADAVEALGIAVAEGGAPMRTEIRTLNGEKLAAVVMLQLDTLGQIDDFRGLAQREGRRVLLERHAAGMHRLLGENVPETAIAGTFDELCRHIVIVAGQVAAVEAVYRAN